jgi:hypothetical protein
MTIELFYLTTQMHRWLNLQVARHLEAQATRLRPAEGAVITNGPMGSRKLGADGPGGSVGLDRRGMPACDGSAEDTEGIAGSDAAAGSRYAAAQIEVLASEKQTVRP